MAHTRVEAELLHDVIALVLRARDADRATAFESRELTDGRAHGAGRRGHDDRLAGLRLTEVVEPDVRGHARHAEHAERRRDRCDRGVELQWTERSRLGGGPRDVVRLPAAVREHELSRAESGMPRF